MAQRGEIALRIVRACQALGIETVVGASAADMDGAAARLADRTICIGPAPASQSYLLPQTVVHAALGTGCDALHPGYGFLSENSELAETCKASGVTFIGPSTDQLVRFGDKLAAREAALEAGVSLLPGGEVDDFPTAVSVAGQIGFPLLLKATRGGGGKGIRVVRDEDQLQRELPIASNEAESAFGDGRLFLERYVEAGRHVEVQIVGDRHGAMLQLGERDCSVQYGYQKLVEESPPPFLDQACREAIREDAVRLGASVAYDSLGTVEFLVDAKTSEFYFLEVNPRIQVEHPVTEAVTGIDLVQTQIRVAAGEPLDFVEADVSLEGHAIECRINAQAVTPDGISPSPGRIERWSIPAGDGVRIDTHCHDGYFMPPYYDSLLAKVIVWGPDREAARQNMLSALQAVEIEGIETNLSLQRAIVADPDFADGRLTTHWLEDKLAELTSARSPA